MKQIIYLIAFLVLATSCEKEKEPENLSKLFSSVESSGCGSFTVYKLNEKENMAIAVLGYNTDLDISTTEQTFDLSQMNPDVLRVEVIKTTQGMHYYCNDVIEVDDEILDKWTSTKGKVSIRITDDYANNPPQFCIDTYRVDVRIENVYLENSKGDKVFVEYLEFKDVIVGWCPG